MARVVFHLLAALSLLAFALGSAGDTTHLLPHVPHFIDKFDLRHLHPNSEANIWYREHARKDKDRATAAMLNLTLHHPTVVLDHSFHTTESCTSTVLTIHFFTQEAFDHAHDVWFLQDRLVFITSKSSCVKFNTESHHTYFLSSLLQHDTAHLLIQATGQFLSIEDVASHGTLQWGHLPSIATSLGAAAYLSRRTPTQNRPSATAHAPTLLVPRDPKTKTTSCDTFNVLPAPSSLHCNATGSISRTKVVTSPFPTATDISACRDFCLNISACISFGYNVTSGECQLLNQNLVDAGITTKKGGDIYYNRHCYTSTCVTSTITIQTSSSKVSPTSSTRASSTISTMVSSTSISPTPTPTRSSSSTLSGYTVYSVTTVPTSSCLSPSATISGLPAVAFCNVTFDNDLDQALGVFNLSAEDTDLSYVMSQIAPGIADDPNNYGIFENYTDLNNNTIRQDLHRQLLEKRWKLKIFKSIAHIISGVVKKVVATVKVAEKLAEFAIRAAIVAVEIVAAVVIALIDPHHVFTPSASFHVGFEHELPQIGLSPWGGRGFLINQWVGKDKSHCNLTGKYRKSEEEEKIPPALLSFNKENTANLAEKFLQPNDGELLPDRFGDDPGIALWCIDCGIKAFFEASGSLDFSLADGITKGHVMFTGDLEAVIQIGLDAMYVCKVNEDDINIGKYTLAKVRLLEAGIPGFAIPGLIVVGPYLTLDITSSVEIKAEGQILAGYSISMPNAISVIDLVDSAKSYSSGWTPTTKTVIDIQGELSVGAALEMPIGIGVGISLLKAQFEKKAALVDTPGVYFDASIKVEWEWTHTTFPDGTHTTESTPIGDIWNPGECPGIDLELSFQNRLEADIFGIRDYTLLSYSTPLKTACITLWDKPPEPPTPPSPYTYIGCYHDATPPPGPFGGLSPIVGRCPYSSLSNRAQCEAACSGYLYFGLESGGACCCANSMQTGTYQLSESSCPLLCSQSTSERCGGRGSLTVYAYTDPSYIAQATSVGLQWWAWLVDPPLDSYSYYDIHVLPIANSDDWRYTGSVDNINNAFTVSGRPYIIQLPGQAPINDGSQVTVILQGYFLPTKLGIYKFRIIKDNQVVLMWVGPDAHIKYTGANAVMSGMFGHPDKTTWFLKPLQYIAVSFMWINYLSDDGGFIVEVTDPDLYVTTDTSGMFRFDPAAGLNDGHVDSYNRKRDVPFFVPSADAAKVTTTPNSGLVHGHVDSYDHKRNVPSSVASTQTAMITTAPDVDSVRSVMKRQVTSQGSGTILSPNTGVITTTDVNGELGEISGPLAVMIPLGNDVDLLSNPQIADPTPNATYVWTTPTMTLDEINAANGENSTSFLNSTDPVLKYANIFDLTGTLQLITGQDSNLYLTTANHTDTSCLYAGDSNVYAGDSDGNLFIYYKDEYTALNVSRFRAVSPDAIPITAQLVSLVPVPTEAGYVYVAMDTMENAMFLAFCNLEGAASKLFLVSSLDTGLHTLTQPELAWIVTGGVVTACGPVVLAAVGGVEVP